MNLIKIGKFIADCRKEKKITQEQLAEKLYITDRAVSKWERGLSLPDADKMIELCNVLGINVNELLNGERINMNDYDKKSEEMLVKMAKQEEEKNKKLLLAMWVILISSTIFYTGILLISAITLGEGIPFGIIVVVSTFILLCVCFFALKLELDAGYYECKKCHHRYVPSYKQVLFAPHMSTRRYLKCPKCEKRSWAKKVMSKE